MKDGDWRNDWYGYNWVIDNMICGIIVSAVLALIELVRWLLGYV